MNRLRGKLTYSNVMVTILALIVIGGGTAYAQTVGLPPNSVGGAQLQANSVGLGELKSDSVGSAELQPEAVGPQQIQLESISAAKLKDGSVTFSKLSAQLKGELKAQKGGTGAAGATGAQGPVGAPGVPGTAAVSTSVETEVVNQATATDTTTPKELSVHCPNGPVLGGGYVLHSETAPGAAKLRAIRSYPVDTDTWLVRAVDDSAGAEGPWELTVSVVCAK
jgi:hypothetical protein